MEKMFGLVDEWDRDPSKEKAITRECLEIEQQVNEFLDNTQVAFPVSAPSRSNRPLGTTVPSGKLVAKIPNVSKSIHARKRRQRQRSAR